MPEPVDLEKNIIETQVEIIIGRSHGEDVSKLEERLERLQRTFKKSKDPSTFRYGVGEKVYVPKDLEAFCKNPTDIDYNPLQFVKTEILQRVVVDGTPGYVVEDNNQPDLKWWLPEEVPRGSKNILEIFERLDNSGNIKMPPEGMNIYATDLFAFPTAVKPIPFSAQVY